MIRDILEKHKIFHFAAVPSSVCSAANRRLYDGIPEGCSVIFALFPYYTMPDPYPLSRFAAVRDYHSFAENVFCEVCGYICEKYPDAYARGFSDHSPFCERDGAAAAGLGIVGEHGLLINREHSSFVFIGEVVTSLDLMQLTAEGIDCGDGEISFCEKCGACAAACPGGCAGEARRDTCASAINQKKGELSDSEIAVMQKSGYIWGCDVCQNVCPHTVKAVHDGTIQTPIEFFKHNTLSGDVGEILDLTDEEYKSYPFSWRKREIMIRNIKILEKGGIK